MKHQITGVVLAGGESSRMGEDKSLMLFKEQQLIAFSLKALQDHCDPILISTNNQEHLSFSLPLIADKYKKIGPIAGIHSALLHSKTDYIIVLPCDSPMVKPQFIQYLISQIEDEIDAVVPQYGKHIEPLFAIYHKRILSKVEDQILSEDYKLQNLLQSINSKVIEVQDRSCFVNINTPEDYRNIARDIN